MGQKPCQKGARALSCRTIYPIGNRTGTVSDVGDPEHEKEKGGRYKRWAGL